MVADTMSRPPPWPQRAAPSTSTPAGPASAVTDVKVPSGSSVAALSAGTVPSPSSRPASTAADVKGPSGFSAAALSVGSRVSSSSPSLVAVVHATAGAALDWAAIAAAQLGCPEISALQQSSGLQLRAQGSGQGLRAAPKEDSDISSAELTYGAPLSLPGQFITAEEPPPAGFVEKLRCASPLPPTRQLTYAEMVAKPPAALMAAKFVYVRRGGVVPPLEPLYLGPYQVLDNGPKVFRLAIGGRAESVSIDRLKPHLGTADVLPQRPPPRVRPPSRGVQSR